MEPLFENARIMNRNNFRLFRVFGKIYALDRIGFDGRLQLVCINPYKDAPGLNVNAVQAHEIVGEEYDRRRAAIARWWREAEGRDPGTRDHDYR